MRSVALPASLLALSLAGGTAALAQPAGSTLDAVQSRGALTICTTGDYKPWRPD